MKPLAGKVAIVTGASAPRGIGRAIAMRLAQDGAKLVVCDIDSDVLINEKSISKLSLLDELVEKIRDTGGDALAVPLDVTSPSDVASCIAKAFSSYGGIDILVNNAATLIGSDQFMSTTPDQWDTSFRVNLLGPMMMTQAVIPHMQKAGGGRVINIGSTGSLGAEPGFGAYTTMKHGLIGFSKTIAAEFGVDGILCNTVCPGYIETDMHLAANTRLADDANVPVSEIKKQRYTAVALRKAGMPSDVADAVAYLAGPQSKYVTGMNLPVTGGVPVGI